MVEPSTNSAPSARKNTGAAAKPKHPDDFGPDEALQILERAIHLCEDAGLPVFLSPMHDQGEEYTGILIKKTRISGKHLQYTGNHTGSEEQHANTTRP